MKFCLKYLRSVRWLYLLACSLCAAFFSLSLLFPALAQEAGDAVAPTVPETEAEEGVFFAPVTIDGDELFLLRGSSVLPAKERAEKVEQRIIEFAETLGDDPIRMTTDETDLGITLMANGRMLTVTTQADSELEQMEIEVLASLQAEAIQAAVEKYRDSRSSDARVDSAFAAIGWSVGFIIVTILFFRRRFKAIEERLSTMGKHPKDSNLTEMDAIWNDIKREEKAGQ